MRRFSLIWFLLLANSAFATHTCGLGVASGEGGTPDNACYISATGNDANSGKNHAQAWLHAPGMPSATGNAASQVPIAGDSYIFRGGDTWHFRNSGASPYTGGTWTWARDGTTTSCQLNPSAGAIVKGTCIYIGTDQTYFAGGSFVRPTFTQDSPFHTNRPANCTADGGFDSTGFSGISLGSHNFLIFNDFELVGNCWNGATSADWISASGNQVQRSNLYFHGWTYACNPNGLGVCQTVDDSYHMLGGNMPKANYQRCDHNVFDGSDSSNGTLPPASGSASGFSINNSCKEIDHNVFNRVSNGCICNPSSVHDNFFTDLYEPQGGVHGNIIETNTAQSVTGPVYFYNNRMQNTNEGVGVWLETVNEPIYLFNNTSQNNANPTNCYMNDQSASTVNIYFFNNTQDAPCSFRTLNGGTPIRNFWNNHFIGYSPAVLSTFATGSGTIINNGGHLFQSEITANAQGYILGNNYAPAPPGGSTVGAAINLVGFCGAISDSQAAAACLNATSGGVSEVSGEGGLVVSSPAFTIVPRPSAVFSSQGIDDTLTNWRYCWAGGVGQQFCTPGGTGVVTSGPVNTINNASPSLDGGSMKFSFTGTAFTDVLLLYESGAHNTATYLQGDYWAQIAAGNYQDLEFDTYQYLRSSLDQFMYGSQCQIGGFWQIWDSLAGTWSNTTVPCSFSTGTFHHITWKVHRVAGDTSCSGHPTMHYDSLTIDGTTNNLNLSKCAGVLPGNFADQTGLNFQLDTNGSGGALQENLDLVSIVGSTAAWDTGAYEFLGGASGVQITPPSLVYGSVIVNNTTAEQCASVQNTGTAALNLSSIALASGTDFAFSGVFHLNACSTSVPVGVGNSCTVCVTFTPTSLGTKNDSVVLTSDAPEGTDSISLNGIGAPPSVGVGITGGSVILTPTGKVVIQ